MTGSYLGSDGDVDGRIPQLDAEIGHLRFAIDGLTAAVVELKQDVKGLFATQKTEFMRLFDRQDTQFATYVERLDAQHVALVKREDDFLTKLVNRHDEMIDRQSELFATIVKRQDTMDERQLVHMRWLVGLVATTAVALAGLIVSRIL